MHKGNISYLKFNQFTFKILYNENKATSLKELLKEQNKNHLKRIRLEDSNRFFINGINVSKNQFLQEFKKATETIPSDEKLLGLWQHNESTSFLNTESFLFIISNYENK